MEIVLSIEEAARLTGKGKEEFTGENPLDVFNSAIAEKFNRIKTESAAQALRNGLDKREKELAKLVGIESFSNWEDLTTQVAEKTAEKTEGNNTDTENAERIKRLTEQVSEYKAQLKTARTETETVKKDFEHRAILTDVTNKTKQHIEGLNLSLPSDPLKRARAIDKILKMEFDGKRFQQNGDGFIVLDANGQPLQDESLNDITATQLAERSFLEMYPTREQQKNTSNPPTPNGEQNTVF